MIIGSNKKSKNLLKKLKRDTGPISFGDLLLYYRESIGMTQAALGEKLGLSRQFVCDLEKGRRLVSVEMASQVAKAIKEPVAYWVEVALQDQVRKANLNLEVHVAS